MIKWNFIGGIAVGAIGVLAILGTNLATFAITYQVQQEQHRQALFQANMNPAACQGPQIDFSDSPKLERTR